MPATNQHKATSALAAQVIREATAYDADKLPRRLSPLSVGDAADTGYDADLCGDVGFGVKFDSSVMLEDLTEALDDAAEVLAAEVLSDEVAGYSAKEIAASVNGIRIAPAEGSFLVCFTLTIECDLVRD